MIFCIKKGRFSKRIKKALWGHTLIKGNNKNFNLRYYLFLLKKEYFNKKKKGLKYDEKRKFVYNKRLTKYGKILLSRKKFCNFYRLKLKQFKHFCLLAEKCNDNNFSNNLISILERRLVTVVYRMNFVFSILEGFTKVKNGFFLVNKQLIIDPNFIIEIGDIVEVNDVYKEIIYNNINLRFLRRLKNIKIKTLYYRGYINKFGCSWLNIKSKINKLYQYYSYKYNIRTRYLFVRNKVLLFKNKSLLYNKIFYRQDLNNKLYYRYNLKNQLFSVGVLRYDRGRYFRRIAFQKFLNAYKKTKNIVYKINDNLVEKKKKSVSRKKIRVVLKTKNMILLSNGCCIDLFDGKPVEGRFRVKIRRRTISGYDLDNDYTLIKKRMDKAKKDKIKSISKKKLKKKVDKDIKRQKDKENGNIEIDRSVKTKYVRNQDKLKWTYSLIKERLNARSRYRVKPQEDKRFKSKKFNKYKKYHKYNRFDMRFFSVKTFNNRLKTRLRSKNMFVNKSRQFYRNYNSLGYERRNKKLYNIKFSYKNYNLYHCYKNMFIKLFYMKLRLKFLIYKIYLYNKYIIKNIDYQIFKVFSVFKRSYLYRLLLNNLIKGLHMEYKIKLFYFFNIRNRFGFRYSRKFNKKKKNRFKKYVTKIFLFKHQYLLYLLDAKKKNIEMHRKEAVMNETIVGYKYSKKTQKFTLPSVSMVSKNRIFRYKLLFKKNKENWLINNYPRYFCVNYTLLMGCLIKSPEIIDVFYVFRKKYYKKKKKISVKNYINFENKNLKYCARKLKRMLFRDIIKKKKLLVKNLKDNDNKNYYLRVLNNNYLNYSILKKKVYRKLVNKEKVFSGAGYFNRRF